MDERGSTCAAKPPKLMGWLAPGAACGRRTFLAARPSSPEFMSPIRKMSASARSSVSADLAAPPIWPPFGLQETLTHLHFGHSGFGSYESNHAAQARFSQIHERWMPIDMSPFKAERRLSARSVFLEAVDRGTYGDLSSSPCPIRNPLSQPRLNRPAAACRVL